MGIQATHRRRTLMSTESRARRERVPRLASGQIFNDRLLHAGPYARLCVCLYIAHSGLRMSIAPRVQCACRAAAAALQCFTMAGLYWLKCSALILLAESKVARAWEHIPRHQNLWERRLTISFYVPERLYRIASYGFPA